MLIPFTILVIAVITALIFDLINGFHDAANAIATVVSTRVLSPGLAVLWAAFFNFVAIFIFFPHVADTISQIIRIDSSEPVYLIVITCGLLGAITWNLITWWLALPTSSSHALIGGLSGAGIAFGGLEALRIDLLLITFEFIFLAPLIGFGLGFVFMLAMYWLCRNSTPAAVDNRFRKGQLVSAALYSIGHGANDGQKTMGVIMALMIAAGVFNADKTLSLSDPETRWIILSCQAAISIGTTLGGWRIVKTMGMKITKIRPIGGFCAETAGSVTLFLATHLGIPVSTTHTITGSIIGTSAAIHPASHIKWGIAARIVWGWVFTIPAAALIAGTLFYLAKMLKFM